MKPLPADETVLAACEAAHGDIDRIAALFPVVREHRLRGVKLPEGVSPVGCSCGAEMGGVDRWEEHYTRQATGADHHLLLLTVVPDDLAGSGETDPTGATVIDARPQQEHLDRKALLKAMKAIQDVYRARVFLASCLPAVDANLTAEAAGKRLPGQPGTALAGVVPIGQRPRTTSDCTLCAEPAERVRGGWCDRCYHSWQGWRGRSLGRGVTPDRDVFVRWRKAHLEQAAATETGPAGRVSVIKIGNGGNAADLHVCVP